MNVDSEMHDIILNIKKEKEKRDTNYGRRQDFELINTI